MFDGNAYGEFSPEEQELVAEAEGRSPRLVPRPRPRRVQGMAPVQQPVAYVPPARATAEPSDVGAVLAILVAMALLAAFAAGQHKAARTPGGHERPVAGTPHEARHAPTSQAGPSTHKRARPLESRTNPPRTHGRREKETVSPPTSAQRYLPPGWIRLVAGGELPIFQYPSRNAPMVARVEQGNMILVRYDGPPSGCWRAAVLITGEAWGATCIYLPPNSSWENTRVPLPPGWTSAVHAGEPLELHSAGITGPVVGRIEPGDEVVFRHVSEADVYFVFSGDGRSWGFARFPAAIGGGRGAQLPAVPSTPYVEGYLPPGWSRSFVREELTLLEHPRWDANSVIRLPAETRFLIRQVDQEDPCWHVIIPDSGQIWGYACIKPVPPDEDIQWPLPEGWERMRYVDRGPAELRGIGLRGTAGYLHPQTEAVMHRVANLNWFLVIAADGTVWGYSRFAENDD